MALQSHFYLSAADDASRYDTAPDSFAPDRYAFERITDVELSILWSILRDEEWDSDLLDHFDMIFEQGGGERLVIKLPAEFLAMVAQLEGEDLDEAAEIWAETEELDCETAEILPIVQALKNLALASADTGKGVYLWIAV